MRKVAVAALVFVLFTVLSASANAESHRRFRREALWHLLGVPAYYLVGINVHEGLGHGMAVAFVPEVEVVSYRPYPHYIRRDDGTIDDVNGAIYFRWEECNAPSSSELAYIMLSPYIVDVSFFVATDLMLSLGGVSPRTQLGAMLYIVGMVGPWIDMFANILGSLNVGNDFYDAAQLLGMHPLVFTGVGSLLLAVGLWRIIDVGVDVFTEPADGPRHRRCRRVRCHRRVNVSVSPYVGENGSGGGLAVGGTM